MQTTEKLEILYLNQINILAEIQVLQSQNFKLSIAQQYELFNDEYQKVYQLFDDDNHELILKMELTDLLFDIHLGSYELPQIINQQFSRLKIIVLKCALHHSAFFSHPDNPFVQYLSTNSQFITKHLNQQNIKQCCQLLSAQIEDLILNFQSDPMLFLAHSKKLLSTLKKELTLNKPATAKKATLKTDSLKDKFSRVISHDQITKLDKTAKLNIQSAKNLAKGEWLELRNTTPPSLIKLIWKADDNSEFIFVNKEGVKVKQSTLFELAADFEQNVISLMSNKNKKTSHKNISVLKTIG